MLTLSLVAVVLLFLKPVVGCLYIICVIAAIALGLTNREKSTAGGNAKNNLANILKTVIGGMVDAIKKLPIYNIIVKVFRGGFENICINVNKKIPKIIAFCTKIKKYEKS